MLNSFAYVVCLNKNLYITVVKGKEIMKKKLLPVTIMCALSLSMLIGCGNGKDKTETVNTDTQIETAAEQDDIESVTETAEEPETPAEPAEPEKDIVEISAEEYLAEYPLYLEEKNIYMSAAPGYYFFPDKTANTYTDENGNTNTVTYLDQYINNNSLNLFTSETADWFSDVYIAISLADTSQVDWYIENKDQGYGNDFNSTFEVNEIETCENGLTLFQIITKYPREQYDNVIYADGLDYDAYTQYTFEEYIDDKCFEITIFNADNNDDIINGILDFYRNSDAPVFAVDTSAYDIVIK